MKIDRFKSGLSSKEISDLNDIFVKGSLAKGLEIEEFEYQLSNYLNCENVCTVSNGFSALFLSLKSLNVKKDDYVVIPAISTCHAVRNAVTATGAIPLYTDTLKNLPVVDYLSTNLVESKIKAIISINHFGIEDSPPKFNSYVPVIKDLSQAFGMETLNKDITCSISSFYFSKILTSIDGGIIFSDSKSLIEKCKELRSYDNKLDQEQRYNFKLNNINAAVGLSRLKKLKHNISRRNSIAKKYISAITESKIIDLDIYNHINIYYKFPILFTDEVKKHKILNDLDKLNIPITSELVFNTALQDDFPNALSLVNRFYSIPCYPDLSDREIEYIVDSLKNTL